MDRLNQWLACDRRCGARSAPPQPHHRLTGIQLSLPSIATIGRFEVLPRTESNNAVRFLCKERFVHGSPIGRSATLSTDGSPSRYLQMKCCCVSSAKPYHYGQQFWQVLCHDDPWSLEQACAHSSEGCKMGDIAIAVPI